MRRYKHHYLISSIICTILGILFLFGPISSLRYLIVAANYPSTLGRVISFRINTVSTNFLSKGTTFTSLPFIEYEYSVNNKLYSSQRILALGDLRSSVKNYSSGQTVRVYFNPHNPKDSFLIFPSKDDKLYLLVIMLIGILILGSGVYSYFIYQREKGQFR